MKNVKIHLELPFLNINQFSEEEKSPCEIRIQYVKLINYTDTLLCMEKFQSSYYNKCQTL
jgi:hypothetical protein